MKGIVLQIRSRLAGVEKRLKELKSENKILRTEISEIKAILTDGKDMEVEVEGRVSQVGMKITGDEESDDGSSDGFGEEYPVVEIRSRYLDDERNWLRTVFGDLIKGKGLKDGSTLRGTTVEGISNSIPLPENVRASCTLKLCNFLNCALRNPQYVYYSGSSINSGTSKVSGNVSEVFSFKGGISNCHVFCSFKINGFLRLIIYCYCTPEGRIYFGLGFIPADVPTHEGLDVKLDQMSPAPDVWFPKQTSLDPQELFVTSGNFLVRGSMSKGPRSVVHVEILDVNGVFFSSHSSAQDRKRIIDGKIIRRNSLANSSGTISGFIGNSSRFSCIIEIVNCLAVKLTNHYKFYTSSSVNNFLPSEILPCHRERFFGADNACVEGIFSYDIDTTDLTILVGVRVEAGQNSFAAKFVQTPALLIKEELKSLMDANQWKIHDYKKFAIATEGVQFVQMRNIKAEIQMTEDEKSLLKIRIFAV